MSQYLDKDGASRIAENFLSKQAEQDAILTNLQFDLKEAEHALVKTIQGPAPLNIRALTRPLDDYLISGNTVQNGTPTPSDPVDVVGCGVRTKNLLDNQMSAEVDFRGVKYTKNTDGSVKVFGTASPQVSYCILMGDGAATNELSADTTPIFKAGDTLNFVSSGLALQIRYTDGTYESNVSGIVTLTKNVGLIYIQVSTNSSISTTVYPMITLSTETDTGYEPYGYKLPLTVNNTAHPVYLGNVPTTRRIRKLVLTGEENWMDRPQYAAADRFVLSYGGFIKKYSGYCTHYEVEGNLVDKYPSLILNDGTQIIINHSAKGTTTLTDFKQYLAAQYANGTPVTIWYVLATPTTGIVNEPLHKIGDYADTISMAQAGVEISTTKGFNTITTDTTVLPSNIEVKGVINNA